MRLVKANSGKSSLGTRPPKIGKKHPYPLSWGLNSMLGQYMCSMYFVFFSLKLTIMEGLRPITFYYSGEMSQPGWFLQLVCKSNDFIKEIRFGDHGQVKAVVICEHGAMHIVPISHVTFIINKK